MKLPLEGNVFRVGDKVMQTENDYDKQVFNGDMGRIVSLDREGQHLVVEFADAEGIRYVAYQRSEWDQLELSYAISVHKSQGSEYPVVVMPFGLDAAFSDESELDLYSHYQGQALSSSGGRKAGPGGLRAAGERQ